MILIAFAAHLVLLGLLVAIGDYRLRPRADGVAYTVEIVDEGELGGHMPAGLPKLDVGGAPGPERRAAKAAPKPPPPPRREEPPPPPKPEPEPEPPPKPEPPKEKPKPKVIKEPPKETLPPPPSNSEPPPEAPAEPVPLVTGISMQSTVANSGGPKVRVGNTTYGDPNKEKFTKPEDVKAYSGGSENFAPVRAANVSSSARVIKEYRPRYPRQLKEEGVEGVVILRVQVTREGKTRKVKVVKGLHPVLDNLSIQAVERFVWAAAEVDGQKVDSVITYRMTWELFD